MNALEWGDQKAAWSGWRWGRGAKGGCLGNHIAESVPERYRFTPTTIPALLVEAEQGVGGWGEKGVRAIGGWVGGVHTFRVQLSMKEPFEVWDWDGSALSPAHADTGPWGVPAHMHLVTAHTRLVVSHIKPAFMEPFFKFNVTIKGGFDGSSWVGTRTFSAVYDLRFFSTKKSDLSGHFWALCGTNKNVYI